MFPNNFKLLTVKLRPMSKNKKSKFQTQKRAVGCQLLHNETIRALKKSKLRYCMLKRLLVFHVHLKHSVSHLGKVSIYLHFSLQLLNCLKIGLTYPTHISSASSKGTELRVHQTRKRLYISSLFFSSKAELK